MTFDDGWIAFVIAAIGLLAVYLGHKVSQQPPPKTKVTMPKLTLVERKKRAWK